MDRNICLLKEYHNGNEDALERLVKENEKLVWSVVNRMYHGFCEAEDMFQTGCIGLIKAAQRFDFEKGTVFSTYAVYMIMGEIKRFLRDDGMIKVSRGLKELGIKVKKISTEHFLETGKEPSITEIAKKINCSEAEVTECMEASSAPMSINKLVGNGEIELESFISDDIGFDEKIINSVTLAQAANTLKGREKYILLMRYFKNKTQAQVASELGVSQVQVSRLEKKILENLKKEIV